MKRSRDVSKLWSGYDDEMDYVVPPRPAKRLSMIDNTPQQWKEERRYILKLSKQKLKLMDNPLRDLQRSVLITNTTRRMKMELEENGTSKFRGYKRNHASIMNKRKLRQRSLSSSSSSSSNSWETMVNTNQKESRQEISSDSPMTDIINSSKCDPKVTASNEKQSTCQSDLSALKETVLSHMMDISTTSTTNSSSLTTTSPSTPDSDWLLTDCDKPRNDISDVQTNTCNSNSSCETSHSDISSQCSITSYQDTDSNMLSCSCASLPVSSFECVKAFPAVANYSSHNEQQQAASTDKQSTINECNYSASLRLHSHDIGSAGLVDNVSLACSTTGTDVYAAMYGLHYKQYSSSYATTAAAYLQYIQQPNYTLHNQYLFTLAELMRNNNYVTSPLYHGCNTTNYFSPSFDSYADSTMSCDVADTEEAYIDIMT